MRRNYDQIDIVLIPEKMTVSAGAGVGGPGVVEPVALDLERATAAGQLGAHSLEEPLNTTNYFFE